MKRMFQLSDRAVGYILFAPTFMILVILNVYVFVNMVYISFQDYDVLAGVHWFTGLHNYIYILSEAEFWRSLWNDIVFTAGNLSVQVVAGIAIAILLNAKFAGSRLTRSMIIFSYLIPTLVAVLAFRFMLSEFTGVITHFLSRLNTLLPFNLPTALLGSTGTAMSTVITISNWKFFPFAVLTFLAQLQSINPQQYEAARIDGATRWQEFRHITIPHLLPVVYMVLLLRSIWTFNKFDIIYLLTGGGPLGVTQTPPLLIYKVFFGQYAYGRAAAIAMLMLILLVTSSLGYFKLYQRAYRKMS